MVILKFTVGFDVATFDVYKEFPVIKKKMGLLIKCHSYRYSEFAD